MAKKKPICKLTGEDGNVFNVIGRVCRALKVAGQDKEAEAFRKAVFASDSYDAVLRLAMKYTEVK